MLRFQWRVFYGDYRDDMWDSHYEDSAAIGPASSVDFFSGDILTYPVPANPGIQDW